MKPTGLASGERRSGGGRSSARKGRASRRLRRASREAFARFQRFVDQGGKFRVGVINACNLDCFFCHNEAMPNPRRLGKAAGRVRLPLEELAKMSSAYAALGGPQINVTGGEPLAQSQLFEFLDAIDEQGARIVLNTNAVLAERLLSRPKVKKITGILASVHTTSDKIFREQLGGSSAQEVLRNVVALDRHGYAVELNYSLGPYNQDEFEEVLEFAVAKGLNLKAIALVRPHEGADFYGGEWVDPRWLEGILAAKGARERGRSSKLGGTTTTYDLRGTQVKVKNVARGRLRTDFCRACPHESACGEGIYGLRVGVDGFFKPCLLRKDRFSPIDPERSYEEQLLEQIGAMVGDWSRAEFVGGAPA
ncbi:MAG: radical SAM protein [Planctomycetes bacterium]|nr:radical SAM protein [Planctomycetota bacterium]